MWMIADQDLFTTIATAVASCIGGGGIATVLTTWSNNKKEDKQNVLTLTLQRLEALEIRDQECNKRVTELERRNVELEREAFFLRTRIQQIENDLVTAVISANSLMKITKWNSGATLMFGYLESEMLGQDVDVLVPGNLKQKHHDAYEIAINDLDGVTDWQKARPAVAVHKDGHEFAIQLYVTSFLNGAGEKFFEARISRPRVS